MHHPMFSRALLEHRHFLAPEAGACLDFPEGGCRVLLTVGQEFDGPAQAPRRHGLVLREETVALLRCCLLTLTACEPRPGSRLYRLPCHWAQGGEDAPEGDPGEGGAVGDLLRPLDHLCLLRPEGVAPLNVGETEDDAVRYAGLVGLDEESGSRRVYFFHKGWVEQLWQALLLGPGACFASEGSPYHALLGLDGDDQ